MAETVPQASPDAPAATSGVATGDVAALQVVLDALRPLLADNRPAVCSLALHLLEHLYRRERGKTNPRRAVIARVLVAEAQRVAAALVAQGDVQRRLSALEKKAGRPWARHR